MNKLNTIVAAAVVVAASIAVAPANAASTVDPVRVVKFQDLNLSTSTGAASLYSRLQTASRSVCSPLAGRELSQVKQYNACYEKALGDAVKQLPNLTASTK
jgi:UrcA family protein